jgi:hypothetical protein
MNRVKPHSLDYRPKLQSDTPWWVIAYRIVLLVVAFPILILMLSAPRK